MADLPVEQKDTKKEVPLTLEQRIERIEKDIVELARGVNVQGSLLESIVGASDHICKSYSKLITVPEKPSEEKPKA